MAQIKYRDPVTDIYVPVGSEGPAGPQGPEGPQGPSGVISLADGAPVPGGTPAGTVIVRYST